MARKTLIQVRRDTAANWTSANPTLAAGELGFETNTAKFKIGDGSTAWASLSYFIPGVGAGGAVASDAIWDAKGDLAVGTAADTASKLAVGSNDQVLVADSGQATGVKWAAVPGTSAFVPYTIIDAKGDLIVGTAADTAARLAVGADGTIPMADAGETTGIKWSTLAPKRAGGSSTSGTPGTSIADIQATSGYKLVAWTVNAGQANAANTQITVTVTFSDATTMALASVAATATVIIGNWGELLRIAAGVMNSSSAQGATKDVTRIQVTTLGTGTGARWAAISALEVWIP